MEPPDQSVSSDSGDSLAASPHRRVAASLLRVAASLFAGISRSAVIIGFVSLFSDISGEMIYPVLPLFLTSAIPATIAALLILTVKERREPVASGAGKLRLTLAGTTREYKRLLLVMTVFGLANSANAFLILRAQQLGLATGAGAGRAMS